MSKLTAAALALGVGISSQATAEDSLKIPTCDYQDSITVSFDELGDQLRSGSLTSMTADFLRAKVAQGLGEPTDQSFLNNPVGGSIVAYRAADGNTYGFSRSSSYDEQMGENLVTTCAVQLDN